MRARLDDQGFTLVELLLGMTLLGLISGPVVGAIYLTLKHSTYTLDRPGVSQGTAQDQLVSSNDQRLLAAAFAADAQSSLTVTATRPACLPAVSGAIDVISFTGPDSTGGALDRTSSAWYYLVRPAPVAGVPQLAVLHRATCSALTSTPSTAISGSVREAAVSRAVGPSNPSVSCDAAALPCSATTKVVRMQLKLGLDSSVVFGVQAQRRLVTS